MPKSRHRKKPSHKPAPPRLTPEELEWEESARKRHPIQAMMALLIVVLLAASMIISVVWPFFSYRQ